MRKKLVEVCGWCFPGILIIDGAEVTHGCCAFHKWKMEFKHILLVSGEMDFWKLEDKGVIDERFA